MLPRFIDAGEYGLALEEPAGALAQDKIAITGRERGYMLALIRQMAISCLARSVLPAGHLAVCS